MRKLTYNAFVFYVRLCTVISINPCYSTVHAFLSVTHQQIKIGLEEGKWHTSYHALVSCFDEASTGFRWLRITFEQHALIIIDYMLFLLVVGYFEHLFISLLMILLDCRSK